MDEHKKEDEQVRFAIVSPDAHGKIDGTNKATLLDRLNPAPLDAADVVIVPISFFHDYVFNTNLRNLRKPIVVIDYTEYGWDYWETHGTHLFGDNNLPEYLQTNPEWAKLDEWLHRNPPVLTLKRELRAADAGPRVKPIEFLAMQPASPVQTRAEWDARPYDVFNCWGYSHPLRPSLHGKIFEGMGKLGLNVISDWSQFVNMPAQPRRTWVSIYSPYWVRQPMNRVMEVQRQSRLSVSLPGAGEKCFRSSESPVDCVMALLKNDMAWSYPWIGGHNCIELDRENPFGALFITPPDSLYDIYLRSMENIDNYRPHNYLVNYVLPTIAAAL